jgi:hypothetical protein
LKFKPPKPSYQQAIADLLALFRTDFVSKKFQDGILSAFIETGTQPMQNQPMFGPVQPLRFAEYKEEKDSGLINFKPTGTVEDISVSSAVNAVLDGDESDTDSGADGEEPPSDDDNEAYDNDDEEVEVDE